MLRRSVGKFLHGAPANGDQHNGNQHHRNVLECPVARHAISFAAEYHKRANEIKYQPQQKLRVGKDECEEAEFVVSRRKRRFARPTHQRFYDQNHKHDQHRVSYQRVKEENCAVHNGFISPEKYDYYLFLGQ